MSAERRLELLSGDGPAIIARAVELVGTVPGAQDFELAYTAADRVLAEDEEPRDDEAVAWTATATVRRKYAKGTKPITRTYTGTGIAAPGESHAQASVTAVVELLRAMGANVTVLIEGAE
jgi:hypothetical protein